MKVWRTVADLNHIGIQFIPHREHSLSPLLRIIREWSLGTKTQRIVQTHETLSAQFFNVERMIHVATSVLQKVTCTWRIHVSEQFNILSTMHWMGN